MRGHLGTTLIVAIALIVAMAIFCAGGFYYVEYQVWDSATSTYVYRGRPFSGAVLGVSVVISGVVLCTAALLLRRAGRVHGKPVLDECPNRAQAGRPAGVTPGGDTAHP